MNNRGIAWLTSDLKCIVYTKVTGFCFALHNIAVTSSLNKNTPEPICLYLSCRSVNTGENLQFLIVPTIANLSFLTIFSGRSTFEN